MSPLKKLLQLRGLLIQAPAYIPYWLLSWIYPTRVLRLKAAVTIHPEVRKLLLRRSGIVIGEDVVLSLGCLIVGISRHPPALTLGDRCAIGPGVTFVTSSYPEESLLCRQPYIRGMIKRLAPITVEQDAWLGAGVIVLPGITIGREAIVAAGAVVTHDIPPRSVVMGVPGRIVRELPAT